jgi:hypothetical protein
MTTLANALGEQGESMSNIGWPCDATRRRRKLHTEHDGAPFGLRSTVVRTERGRRCNANVSASAKALQDIQYLKLVARPGGAYGVGNLIDFRLHI